MEPESRRPTVRLLWLVFLPPLLVVLGFALIAAIYDVDVGYIVRDPASTLDAHPLVGALSQLGVIVWWATASICLFAYAAAQRLGSSRGVLVFLLTSGLLTVLLAVDDQFLLHDDLASRYLGLRERHVIAVWLALVAGWLLLNLSVIRRSEWLLMGAAFALFAGSIATDLLVQTVVDDLADIGTGFDMSMLLEDGLKFVGIAVWGAYLVRFSLFAVTSQADEARAS